MHVIAIVIVLIVGLFAATGRSNEPNIVSSVESARQLDACIAAVWSAEKEAARPTPVCDDATFLRRVWLDVAGRVPPYEDADRLAKSDKPLNRAALVDKLLESPSFSAYWSHMWSEYLLGQRPFDQPEFSGRKLRQFLRESLLADHHYDRIASDLILAIGTMDESGPVNFLLRYNADSVPVASAVSQKLMGLTLQCAECHDHPHAGWKQTDLWGLSAYFARLRRMNPANPQPNEQFSAVLERPRGEFLVIDKKGTPDEQGNFPTRTVMPQLPGATRRDVADARREALATWLTAPNNPYFARHFVNQVWRKMTGTQLAATFDPPSATKANSAPVATDAVREKLNPAILEHLRADFVASGFDIHRLITVIALSETYQRATAADAPSTSKPAGEEQGRGELRREQEWLERGLARPLSPDQLHLSIGQAFGYYFDDNDRRLALLTEEEFTVDVPVNSFGAESQSLGRALALFNGEHVRGAVDVAAQSLLRIHGEAAGPKHIERLFLCLLSRRPTPDELDDMLVLAGADIPQRGLEDATWLILNSAEFQTNH